MTRLLHLLIACCFTASAWAQQAPLAIDQPRTQVGSVGSGGELHPFIGLAGDKVEVRLDAAAGADLVVYGPDGGVLGHDARTGARSVQVSLPSDGIYFVGVSVWQAGEYVVHLKRTFTAAPPRRPPPPVDPAWGLYARLPGEMRSGSTAETAGSTQSWRWERDGEVLLEEWHRPRNFDKLVFTARITRGATPGTLLLSGDSMGNKQWAGQVAADGSVTWAGVKGMQFPYRVSLLDDDRMRVEYLDKSGGVKRTLWYLPADAEGLLPTPTP
jgi:hypothetical protein